MPPKSKVSLLEPDIRAELDRLLVERRHSLDKILAHLRKLDVPEEDVPSRSALGRYAQDFERIAARLRQNREMARALAQELGPQSLEGEQGRILIEGMRTLVYDVMQARLNMKDGKLPSAKELSSLSKSIRELSQAMRMEQDFAQKIREQTRREMEAEMRARVKALGSASDLKGLSDVELEQKIAELTRA